MGAHTTSDDPTRYRVAGELEAWKLKDPIERVKAYLFKNELADQEFFDGDRRRGRRARRATCAGAAWRCPTPDPLAIFENVYAEPHALLDEEREQFAAYLDLRGGR